MTVKKVLIVDDSTTDPASSGVEAVAKVNSEKPDVVLLDIIMADMNGFQVCRAITSNAATQNIPVMLVSSKGERTDRIWGELQGARAYITKPFTPEQILEQLARL